uniref:Uncharacterized protein n=1 Tax=Xanthomonas campestris pv. campestris TaxID=340 RepID=A0A0C7KNE1_XANCE|nr:hypothetical protein pXCCB1459_0007 [Xanthomonas campestris pv. campestris]
MLKFKPSCMQNGLTACDRAALVPRLCACKVACMLDCKFACVHACKPRCMQAAKSACSHACMVVAVLHACGQAASAACRQATFFYRPSTCMQVVKLACMLP